MSKKSKQKSCSGDATFHECGKKATVLFEDDWDEIVRSQGKQAGELYTVNENSKVISIRVPKERIKEGVELKLRVFLERVEAKAAGV